MASQDPVDPQTPAVPSRREWLRRTTVAGLGAALGARTLTACSGPRTSTAPLPDGELAAPPMDTVRVGFVGVGGMGSSHVRNLLRIEGVELKAVCDVVPEKCQRIVQWCTDDGRPAPTVYDRGERDFERLCAEEDLDLVYTATPWRWHVPVMLAAMAHGKHAATEVPAAMTVDDCWALVEASERHRLHAVMMENCCYDRREMTILRMCREGLLGELLHAECGYLHDLRGIKFSTGGEGLWRREWSKTHDTNLYPTHGLGPVAQRMDINRGDAFDYLVSMSSPSRGLQLWRDERLADDDPRKAEEYVLGDVNTTLIKTKRGRTIKVVHDTNLPRPYSRIDMTQGTRGVVRGYPDRIYIEGETPGHAYADFSTFASRYEHPLWATVGEQARGAGHGGMDYLEDYRLITCLRRGEPLDMDVYDAATWSCLVDLSGRSVAERSRPMDVPDFTRGRWKVRAPLGLVGA